MLWVLYGTQCEAHIKCICQVAEASTNGTECQASELAALFLKPNSYMKEQMADKQQLFRLGIWQTFC